MLGKIWVLFFPHPHNNHKARILHRHSLLVLLGLLVMAQAAIGLSHQIKPGVLGYASVIPPQTIIELTNNERTKLGLASLKVNSELTKAAEAKAVDMFAKGYWAHNAPDGTEPWSFILNAGYSYLHAGENLARDFNSPEAVVTAWMNSPSHKANLISPKYQDIGVAVMDGKINGVETTLVVQMFGTLQSVAPKIQAQNTSVVAPVLAAAQEAKPVVAAPQPLTVPKISPFDVSRSVSLAFVILIVVVLAFDWLIVWRRNLVRISGKSWAHLTFFATMIIILIILKRGLIL